MKVIPPLLGVLMVLAFCLAGTVTADPSRKPSGLDSVVVIGGPCEQTATADVYMRHELGPPVTYFFEPRVLTIEPGTLVTWTDQASHDHTTSSNDTDSYGQPLWHHHTLLNETYSVLFCGEGDYYYHCHLHTQTHDMNGRVSVGDGYP